MSDDLPRGCIPIDQPMNTLQRKWLREVQCTLYGPWHEDQGRLFPKGFLRAYERQERRDLLRASTSPPRAYGWTQRRDDDLAKELGVSERTIRRDLWLIDKGE